MILIPFIFITILFYSYPHNVEKNTKLHHVNVVNATIVNQICYNEKNLCKLNDSEICAMRKSNGITEYKEFNNWCALFVFNLCNYPRKEFAIVGMENCEDYFKSRRQGSDATATDDTIVNTDDGNSTSETGLRSFSPLYEVEQAFDGHFCPLSCPDTYAPSCINSNKGMGKHFKFFTFVNHCVGDMYFCKNWEEFMLPASVKREEKIDPSPLSWSYCGAYRYLQFSRFAEVTSSMGFYGWLHGDQRYTKILEPHERDPGYG